MELDKNNFRIPDAQCRFPMNHRSRPHLPRASSCLRKIEGDLGGRSGATSLMAPSHPPSSFTYLPARLDGVGRGKRNQAVSKQRDSKAVNPSSLSFLVSTSWFGLATLPMARKGRKKHSASPLPPHCASLVVCGPQTTRSLSIGTTVLKL